MPIHIIDYSSKQQRHVVRATFSAELYAATDTIDVGLLQAVTLEEISQGRRLEMSEAKRIMEYGPSKTKVCLCIDAMSVFSSISAATLKVPAEGSTYLHLKWVRELIERGVLHTIAWVDTRCMVADGLTKGSIDRKVLDDAMSGDWHIVDTKTWLPNQHVQPARFPAM